MGIAFFNLIIPHIFLNFDVSESKIQARLIAAHCFLKPLFPTKFILKLFKNSFK